MEIRLTLLVSFVLVLSRLGGLLMTAPVFGSRNVPVRVRALLAVGLSLLLAPLQPQSAAPTGLVDLLLSVGHETGLGVALGMGVAILFTGLQVTGQILGQMGGMQLADIYNPQLDDNVPVFGQLLDLVSLAVFLCIGGHRQVIGGLLETFQWMPPGSGTFAPGAATGLVEVLSQSFRLGVRAAAPVMVSLLLSILVMGLISRTLPQLNILAVGFSFNSIILLAAVSIALGSMVLVFQGQADWAVEEVLRNIAGTTG